MIWECLTSQIAACIILGVGIWIALENNDVTTVFEIASQTNKMRVPIMLVTVASGAVIAVAFLGGYGAHRENQLMVSGVRQRQIKRIRSSIAKKKKGGEPPDKKSWGWDRVCFAANMNVVGQLILGRLYQVHFHTFLQISFKKQYSNTDTCRSIGL